MSGRGNLRMLGVWMAALLTLAATSGASASAGSAPRTFGPARHWGGTLVKALDPTPSLPVASSPSASPPRAVHPPDQILSNEMTFTRWAYVYRIANIYSQPSTSSRRITRLHWYTEDGFPEIYLLLRAHWDSQGQEWIKLRIPARPNGQVGWVERNALGAIHPTHDAVVVNRERLRLYFYVNGVRIWSAAVAVGKASTPTPAGRFWIRERFVLTDPSDGYFPYAFGTSDYSTLTDWPGGGLVGIHGPYYQPQDIPGRVSHGCIRLQVPADFWLGQHLKLGTPVRVV